MNYTTDKTTHFGFLMAAGIDTAFVLLFLSIEYGRSASMLSLDAGLIAITMAMLIVLPYFLPSRFERPLFGSWLIGRSVLALTGIALGFALKQNAGVILPEAAKFMPLTLLIVASMISCYIQFYGLLKLRLAE